VTESIANAVRILRNGGIVSFPTETVYGLGADASNPLAIRQIFAQKGRPTDHPLIVHISDQAELTDWAHPDPRATVLGQHFWPGPLTLILNRQANVPDEVTGGLQTVGVRVPRHPIATELLRAFGGGLAAPSANRFGHLSPTTAAHVRAEFGDRIPIIDGGPCAVGVESTIIDLSGPHPALLRPGGIPIDQIEAIVGPCGSSSTPAPGTLPSHYAPVTSLLISNTPLIDRDRLVAQGRNVAVLLATDPKTYAQHLYAELRRLDGLGVEILIAQTAENVGLGLAVNDRLRRASADSCT